MSSRRVAAAAVGLVALNAYADEPNSQSVTVLNASDLEARGITALDGIAAAEPSISYTPALNSLSTLSLYMRGEGPAAPGQITLDGAVGIYQDGFYIPRLQADTFDLLDLDRVEVLAGPQGAQYGRDTTGGVINLTSKMPSGELRFDQDVDFGNRDSYRMMSSLDTPAWHNLSAKLTLLASGIDGYVKNKDANEASYGEEKQRAARLQLRWDPLSSLRADYFIERSGLDSTPEYDSNPTQNGEVLYYPFTYYADPSGPMQSTYRPVALALSTSNHTAQGLTLGWHEWQALTVESRTGYRSLGANEQQDYTEFFFYPLATADVYQQRQFSQDLRLSGELFDRQLSYDAGASYFREKGSHVDVFALETEDETELTRIQAETRSQALYAQLHWQPQFLFARRLEITAAGRYTRDSKDATRSIFVDDFPQEVGALNHTSYNRATPEASVVYHWSDGISTYAKVATGYEAGGALETAPADEFATTHFRPETSTTYEVGFKSAFLQDRLHADLTLFDSHRKDVQYVLPVYLFAEGDLLDFERVKVRGASFDVSATPLRDLTLSASATYLHWDIDWVGARAGTIFDPASGYGSPYVVGENISKLFALPYTPKYSASVASDYTFLHLDRKDVLVHLDYTYRAEMFSEAAAGPGIPDSQYDTQPAYGLLNGRITLSQETDWAHRVKFSVWGRNILNRKYYQPAVGIGEGVTGFNTAGTAPAGYTSRAGAWAEPMTYGLAVRFEY
jgi:iron complex outermembrane recepter protein